CRLVGIDDGHARIAHVGFHGVCLGVNRERKNIDNQNDHHDVARETSELLDAETKDVLNPAPHRQMPCLRTDRRASRRNTMPKANNTAISRINALASSPLVNTPRLTIWNQSAGNESPITRPGPSRVEAGKRNPE